MYPENPEETQVIVGSTNMGYVSDTARNRAHDLFRPKREPIPLFHSDGLHIPVAIQIHIRPILFQDSLVLFSSISGLAS